MKDDDKSKNPESKDLAEMAKIVLGNCFNNNARRQVAKLMFENNLKRVRANLGEVQTSLTTEIGHAEGVGSYPVREIMYVYGIDRSTAYRWKKFNCHPWLEPELDSSKRIRWTDQPKSGGAGSAWQRKPYNPRREVIAWARSSIRCAIRKLEKMDADPHYDRFPFDEDCEKAADEASKAARHLSFMVYDALHPDEEY